MGRDYIDIGAAPAEEDCVQVNKEGDYHQAMRAECIRFVELIRKHLGPEPEGAQLGVKSNPHDFGTYYSAVCYFEDENEEARKYAFRCEAETPARWDPFPVRCLGCDHVDQRKSHMEFGPCPKCGGTDLAAQTPEAAAGRRPVKVCDECLTAAYDMGVHGREEQAMVMAELGADVADHLCAAVEAPDIVPTCACACRRGR